MIMELENTGCRRCGSSDTKLEVLIPGRNITAGEEDEFSTEVFCKDCGKIHRTDLAVSIK